MAKVCYLIVNGERHDHEHCDDCGAGYTDIYRLDDELWKLIHERAPGGLLCPSCAVRRALRLAEPTHASEKPSKTHDFYEQLEQ